MASRAAVEIKPRAEAVGTGVDLLKDLLRHLEELTFRFAETRQRSACSGRAAAHTGVDRGTPRRRARASVLGLRSRIGGRGILSLRRSGPCSRSQQYGGQACKRTRSRKTDRPHLSLPVSPRPCTADEDNKFFGTFV